MNNKLDIKDLVVIDIDKYNNLQGENLYLREENKKLLNEMEIFKNYFINDMLQKESYMLSHIENYDLSDYYACQLVIKFFEKGITDLEFIFDSIKNYEDKNNKN